MENQTERTFEELTKEEKLVLLALYVNHPFAINMDQIHRMIRERGWDKLSDEEVERLRIMLVRSRYN